MPGVIKFEPESSKPKHLNADTLQTKDGGAEGIRTPDPHNAIVVLYQLSYDPIRSSDTLNSRSILSKQNAEFY